VEPNRTGSIGSEGIQPERIGFDSKEKDWIQTQPASPSHGLTHTIGAALTATPTSPRTRWRVCPTAGCPEVTEGGPCRTCKAKAEQRRRPEGNPYNNEAHRKFRRLVLDRDPICVDCQLAASTDADHDPHERTDLIRMGLDPNDPQYGRGRCHSCHARRTAATRPGGWAAPAW
jgi:5-methylcytosine-specific restriction protein A